MLKSCAELGIAFVPFSPLGRQFLTGKSCDINGMLEDDFRYTFARPRFEPDNFAMNSKLLVPFEEFAQQQHCSMAQLALAWLLAQGEFIVPIPGTKHIDYMTENLDAGEIELDHDTATALGALINEQSVSGERYIPELMRSSEAERD